jgi:hypothetical protein
MAGFDGIAELRLWHSRFFGHQVCVDIVLDNGDTTPNAGFAVDETPGEEADRNPLVDQQVDIPTQAFGVDDPKGEHFQVHELVLAVVEVFGQGHAVLVLKNPLGLARLPGHPIPDDGVHRVVRTPAVYADPAEFPGLCPFRELTIGAGMHDHIADLVGSRHVPTEVVVSGVDDEDVAFLDFNPLLHHLTGVDVIIATAVTQIYHRAWMDQVIHVQGGDIFSGGMEMDFSIQMGSQVVGVSEDLPVGPIWAPGV